MLHFNLGSIPVGVRFSHFLMSAAIALSFLQGQSGSLATAPVSVAYVASIMAVIFISVLVHELGHALASQAFGYRPNIELVWMGGLTRPNAPGPIPWYRDVLLTLAGPASGLVLGAICLLMLGAFRPTHSLVKELVLVGLQINVGWSMINLLPVPPLDGGRICAALLIRLFGRRGFLLAQCVALGVCGSIVLLLLLSSSASQTFLVLFFALFGMRSIGQIAAYLRGESPPGLEHPSERVLALARAAYSAGSFEEARRHTEQVLEEPQLSGVARSRAHHLLGWIYLKQGQGRAALDEFSKVQGQPVEPQALAAALSLIGEEAQAVPVWETAFRETGDRTILHEWAGALIRVGRVEEAQKLSGVDMAAAFLCAQRILFIRGQYSEAAQMGLKALEGYPSAQIAYDTACALARAGDVNGSLRTLQRASELGFSDAAFAESDADLASLHAHPEFHAWLQRLRRK